MMHVYYGPESGERLRRIRKVQKALSETYGEGLDIYKYFLPEDKVDKIVSDLDNGALFASHTFAIINNAEALNKKGKELQKFLKLIKNKNLTLLFNSDAERVDSWFLSHADPRAKDCFKELSDTQKESWVRGYLERQNVHIQEEALELFLFLVEGNTQGFRQELDRLLLFFAAEGQAKHDATISTEFVDRYIYHSREESTHTLFEAYAERDFTRALGILGKLRGEKAHDETSILIRMGYHIRQLATLGNVQRSRSLTSEDFRKAWVYGARNIALCRAALGRLDTAALQRHLVLCGEFEMMLRHNKTTLHYHISQLWLYSLFFSSWKMEKRDERLFTVDHQRFG